MSEYFHAGLFIFLVGIGVTGVVAIYFIRELNDPNATKGRLYQISVAIICIILTIINLWLYLRGV